MFRILILALALCPSLAFAELHKGSVLFIGASGSGDISLDGLTFDADNNSTSVDVSYFLGDHVELGGSLYAGDVKFFGQTFDVDGHSFGVTVHTDRVDYQAGTGRGFFFGIRRDDTEVTYNGPSTVTRNGVTINFNRGSFSNADTFLTAGFNAGLGDGWSMELSFEGESGDLGDNNEIGVALRKCVDRLCFLGGVSQADSKSNNFKTEETSFGIGLEVLF